MKTSFRILLLSAAIGLNIYFIFIDYVAKPVEKGLGHVKDYLPVGFESNDQLKENSPGQNLESNKDKETKASNTKDVDTKDEPNKSEVPSDAKSQLESNESYFARVFSPFSLPKPILNVENEV